MKNLTPEHMRCEFGASCPSVRQLEDGMLMITGKWVAGGIKDPDGEATIIIDPALLKDVPR